MLISRGIKQIEADLRVRFDHVAKIITFGESREVALARMRQALDELVVEGIRTNTALHRDLVIDRSFQAGGVSIHYLESKLED